MNAEQRKEYNKKYYETKKDDIKKKLFTKVECPKCGRIISHQNVKKHQLSSYCIARCHNKSGGAMVQVVNSTSDIEELKKKVKELEEKLSSSE
jgi:hypothetical protein